MKTTNERAETMKRNVNVYHDATSGGWVREVLALEEWIRVGVFGTRAAALSGNREGRPWSSPAYDLIDPNHPSQRRND